MPTLEPARAGCPPTGRHDDVVAHRQARAGQRDLHVRLVHADRAREDARPDVGDVGHLEETLDRAVLAVGAVQHREDDVEVAEGTGGLALVEDGQGAGGGVTGQHDGRARGVDLGQLAVADDHRVRVVDGEHPAALGGDADRHHLVEVPVDGPQHAARGHAGHGVLGGTTAEDHGNTGLPVRAHRSRRYGTRGARTGRNSRPA
jgi:hypothetical protein